MEKENITRFKLDPKKPPKTDWRAFGGMTEEERHQQRFRTRMLRPQPKHSLRALVVRRQRERCARS